MVQSGIHSAAKATAASAGAGALARHGCMWPERATGIAKAAASGAARCGHPRQGYVSASLVPSVAKGAVGLVNAVGRQNHTKKRDRRRRGQRPLKTTTPRRKLIQSQR